jgi:hypothetical protein
VRGRSQIHTRPPAGKGRESEEQWADLVELEPLVVGRVEDSLDFGLALGGEGRVGEDEVEARRDVGGPLAEHLLAHDLGAGAEAVEAQEPRAPGAQPLTLRVAAAAAQASHDPGRELASSRAGNNTRRLERADRTRRDETRWPRRSGCGVEAVVVYEWFPPAPFLRVARTAWCPPGWVVWWWWRGGHGLSRGVQARGDVRLASRARGDSKRHAGRWIARLGQVGSVSTFAMWLG